MKPITPEFMNSLTPIAIACSKLLAQKSDRLLKTLGTKERSSYKNSGDRSAIAYSKLWGQKCDHAALTQLANWSVKLISQR